MSFERDRRLELERKNEWLHDLSEFIVEANLNTWAADGTEVEPERPGYKELEYKKGLWRLRDSYTGYYQAPGMTTIYYKDVPAWNMQYGGPGMTPGFEGMAKPAFEFLREALKLVTPQLPYRGPHHFSEGDFTYGFTVNGDITDATWREWINHYSSGTESYIKIFEQRGLAGTIIQRTPDRQPQYPWNL